MSLNKIVTLNFSEEDLLEIYNISPKILLKFVALTKISPKEESLSKIDREPISFTESLKGDYWLIAIEDNNNYLLLPKSKLGVNPFNYQTVQSLFECQGYQAAAAKEFTLKKPARVSLSPSQDWILEEKGVLEFSIASSSSQFQSQLEQAQQEKIQLQVKLDKLHSHLTKFESEREQYLSHLELFKQMQQASDQSMLLLSEKIQRFVNDGFTRLESRINAIEQNLKSDTRPSKSEATIPLRDSSEFHEKAQIAKQDVAPTPEEQKLAEIYNNKDHRLIEHHIKVLPTQVTLEQERLGDTTKLFSPHPKGTYWIIYTQENKCFLVPEYRFRLHLYNYQSFESYFACHGNYEEGELKMVKPAIAKPLDSEGEKWELVAQGVIEFTLSAELEQLSPTVKQKISDDNWQNNSQSRTIQNPVRQSVHVPILRSQEPQKIKLIEAYNTNPDSLAKNAIEVSENQDSINQRRLGSGNKIVLERVGRGKGNWWILPLSGTNNYLVPKRGIKINEHNYERLAALFLCNNYRSGNTHFELLKPAKVVILSQGETWALAEPGELRF